MKKAILATALMLGFWHVSPAQNILQFRATAFAIKYPYSDWTDWDDSSVLIVVDTDKNNVKIYSEKAQEYYFITSLTENDDAYTGDKTLSVDVIDQDGDRCSLRFMFRKKNERWQLYIDYNTVSWVYNITRLN